MFSLKNVNLPKNGKKYGLLPASQKNKQSKLLGKAHSIFQMDDEEKTEKQNVQRLLQDESSKIRKQKQLKEVYSSALEQDATVFQYDEVYDDVSSTSRAKAQSSIKQRHSEKRKESRYIGNLMKQAQLRQIEKDRIYERKLQKEAEEEAKERGEAEMKFVTGAYKAKLKEQKRWELEEKAEEDYEEATSATKVGMGAFYSSLLTKNIALGGDVEKSARSAFTSGSRLNEKMSSSSIYDHKGVQDGSHEESGRKGNSSFRDKDQTISKDKLRSSERRHSDLDKKVRDSRKYNKRDQVCSHDMKSDRHRPHEEDRRSIEHDPKSNRESMEHVKKHSKRSSADEYLKKHHHSDDHGRAEKRQKTELSKKSAKKEKNPKSDEQKTKQVEKKAAIVSAKERYLQRKKQASTNS